MTVLQNSNVNSKGDDVSPPSNTHGPAPVIPFPVARPNRRESLFARQIWSVERRPGFAFPSLYGFSR